MFVTFHDFAAFKAATSVHLQWYHTAPNGSGHITDIQAVDRDGVVHTYHNDADAPVEPSELPADAILVDQMGV